MRNLLDALAANHSTVWLSTVSSFSIAGLLKALASGFFVSLLFSRSSRGDVDESLTQNARLFSAFMDNLPAFAWIKDIEGRYVYVNKLLIARVTAFQSKWLGKTDADLWPGEIGATYRANDLKVVVSRETLETVETYLLDGERRYLLVSKFPILDHTGAVTMVGGTGVDITARRQAGEALRESEDRYQDLVEHSHDMIYAHDLEGVVLFANQTSSQLLGLPASEVVGRRLAEFLVPEVRDQFDAYLAEIRENAMASGLMLVQTSTGERRVCEYSNTLRAEGTGGGPIVRCIARDVTERKRAEGALRESAERFRQLSEAAFEAIILHDQGRILEVNQSFCQMYRYERAAAIRKSVLDLAPPELREVLRQKVLAGHTDPYEGLGFRSDGTIFNAEVAGKPIHYQGRVVRVAAVRDITERKRNERRQAAQYAVTRVLAESATLAEATPELLRVICENLRWRLGEFWGVCEDTNVLRCVDTWHMPALDAAAYIEASRHIELAPGVGLPGSVWQSGQAAWISDVTEEPRFSRRTIAASVGLRRAVAFPILLGDHTLGVMLFFSRRTLEVDEDLLKMMSAIGSQIGQFAERKRVEEALRQAEEEYRTIFENAVEGIFRTTADGRFITANPAMARMLGFTSPEELIREHSDDAKPNCLDSERREEFKRLLDEHGFVRGFEYQGRRKDGSKIWLSDSVRAVRDESRALLYYEGVTEDITERKLAEQTILAQLDELRRWQEVTLGREDRVLELKREVNELRQRLGEPRRYANEADAMETKQP